MVSPVIPPACGLHMACCRLLVGRALVHGCCGQLNCVYTRQLGEAPGGWLEPSTACAAERNELEADYREALDDLDLDVDN